MKGTTAPSARPAAEGPCGWSSGRRCWSPTVTCQTPDGSERRIFTQDELRGGCVPLLPGESADYTVAARLQGEDGSTYDAVFCFATTAWRAEREFRRIRGNAHRFAVRFLLPDCKKG